MLIKMRKIRVLVGRVLYNIIGKHLPVAHCIIMPIGFFSKEIRALCGKMILDKCGSNVNICPKTSFSSSVNYEVIRISG